MAVAAWLRARIATLGSKDLRVCSSFVFGLHEGSRFPELASRKEAAAQYLGCSVSTVWRRADAAITLLTKSTTSQDSVLFQLGQHRGTWVELHYLHGEDEDEGEDVRGALGFLIDSIPLLDWPDKVYALVRFGTEPRTVAAIPAVWVRQVSATQPSTRDTSAEWDDRP